MIFRNRFKLIFILCLTLALAACGGTTSPDDEGDSTGSTSGGGTTGSETTATQIDLIASSTTLASSAVQSGDGVEITAIVRDDDNNAIADPNVQFRASSGRLETGSGAGNGTVTATLYNAPDRANRSITVTAQTGDISDQILIEVTGTRITITGPDAVATGGQATFTAALKDSAGDSISGATLKIDSTLGAPISAGMVDTNAAGEATFSVTEQNPGTDTVSVSDRGASAEKQVAVGGERLTFIQPDGNATPPTVGEMQSFTVFYSDDDGPIAGSDVSFSTSRGSLSSPNPVTTNSQGEASIELSSTVAGQSTVTASAGGAQASRDINFAADVPSTLIFNAASATLTPGDSTKLTAAVRDSFSNLVENEQVEFSLGSGSPGSLSSARSATNDAGMASVTYTAGPSSAREPTEILATVSGNSAIQDSTTITVAGEALSIKLGTGGAAQISSDGTTYDAPYAVLISDAAGNPVSNATVRLNVRSVDYRSKDSTEENRCDSEDVNNNGILDAGEDRNDNDMLDPGHVATVPSSPELDDTGVARFNVTYLSRFADRVKIRLTATAESAGSEGNESLTFDLPGTPNGTNPFDFNCTVQ